MRIRSAWDCAEWRIGCERILSLRVLGAWPDPGSVAWRGTFGAHSPWANAEATGNAAGIGIVAIVGPALIGEAAACPT